MKESRLRSRSQSRQIDPFAQETMDQNLFVSFVPPMHSLVLNKFPSYPNHVSAPTSPVPPPHPARPSSPPPASHLRTRLSPSKTLTPGPGRSLPLMPLDSTTATRSPAPRSRTSTSNSFLGGVFVGSFSLALLAPAMARQRRQSRTQPTHLSSPWTPCCSPICCPPRRAIGRLSTSALITSSTLWSRSPPLLLLLHRPSDHNCFSVSLRTWPLGSLVCRRVDPVTSQGVLSRSSFLRR
jgi:hypothetical protein